MPFQGAVVNRVKLPSLSLLRGELIQRPEKDTGFWMLVSGYRILVSGLEESILHHLIYHFPSKKAEGPKN